jgi:hypothetical protein
MTEEPARREIDLHRRVCVITPDVIDIRPARSAAVAPLIGFLLGVGCFLAALFWINTLPFLLVLLFMFFAIILVPLSGMGFVYSVYGANVVIDRRKRTAVWQQGLFGMGVGTQELVPFEKVERLEIERSGTATSRVAEEDFVQFELSLRKVSGKQLSLGQVTVPLPAEHEGLARVRAVGEALARMTGRPLALIDVEPPARPKRRRKRRRRRAPTAA